MKPRAFRSIALFMAVAVIAAVASFAQPGPSVEAINRAPGSMNIELNPSDRFVRPSDNEIEVTITLSNLRVGAPYYLDVGVYSAEGYVRGCNGDGMKQRHNFRRVTTSTITRMAKVSLSPSCAYGDYYVRATLWDWSSGYSVAFATRGFSVVASTEGQEDRGVCDRSPAIIRYIVTYGPYYVDDCWVVRDADLLAVAATNGTWEDPMIYLANLSIPELRAGDFDGFTNLEVLVLTSNGLTSLPAGIFDDLTSLRRLYLKDNRLTALPDGIFDKLSALEEVILTYNGDSQLDSGLFEHNPKLFITYLNGPQAEQCAVGPVRTQSGFEVGGRVRFRTDQFTERLAQRAE